MNKQISHLMAIFYGLGAYTLWSMGDSMVKLAAESGLPLWQIVEFMSLSSAVTIFLIIAARGNVKNLKPKKIKLELLRSFLLIGTTWANIHAFTHLPLTHVYVVVFLGPMIIAVLAALLMGEHVSSHLGFSLLAGFIGVLIALNPAALGNLKSGELQGYMALPFCLLFYVANMLLMRFMGRSETVESMAFCPQALRALLVLPLCLWSYHSMTPLQVVYVLAGGMVGALAWMLISSAMKHAPAALVTSLHYSQIISAAILGYLIWSDLPSWNMVVGAAIIIASGFYMARHAHRSRRLADQPSPT